MIGHLNLQTAGWWVLQHFTANDPFGVAYNESTNPAHPRPINFAARYETVLDSDGIPIFRRVSSTSGPIGGAICLPPLAPRILAQWGWAVPAKITTASPLKATPVSTGNGVGWTTATDLAEVACYTSDVTAPSVGTFGLLVLGTELGAQNPLFFEGGGGNAKTYQVTVNNADGTYTLQEYTRKGGTTVGAAVALCQELNLAPSVPVNTWVRGFLESDGVVRFVLPLGC